MVAWLVSMKQTHPIFAHTFCLQKYRQYLSLGHIEEKNGKMELYPFYVCKRCSAMHSILFWTFIRSENIRLRKKKCKKNDENKQNSMEYRAAKKHSRNDVISSKDRQWWKSNAMHHWALFNLCVVVVFRLFLYCFSLFLYCIYLQMQCNATKKSGSVTQMNLIVDSGALLVYPIIGLPWNNVWS